MSRNTSFGPVRRSRFLKALKETCNVTLAARAAGAGRRTVYEHREKDPDFRAAWEEALEEAVDVLEAEVHRRAFTGIEKPVFYGGEKIATVREYSDRLAVFLLKAHRPGKYADRGAVDIGTADGSPIIPVRVYLPENGRSGGSDEG